MEKGTIIIEPFMYEKLHLTLPEMAVYAIINGYSKNDKSCFVSLIEMAKMTKLNSVSICRILKRLTEKGYIRKNAINARRIEYTAVTPEELTAKGLISKPKENTANTANLTPKCETQSKVSNHITEENKSIPDEMDTINDKPPDKPTEYGNKMLAQIKASIQT